MIHRLDSVSGQLTWIILAAIMLSACKQLEVASPPPTLISLHVAYTPTLRTWIETLDTCAEDQPEVAFILEELPADQLSTSKFDAVIRLGGEIDSNDFAFIVGNDELKIIVNKLNPVISIDDSTLLGLFDGSLVSWEAISPPKAVYVVSVQPWIYLPGNDISLPTIFGNSVEFKPASAARLASDPGQVIEGIKENEGAIGFVPSSWLTNASNGLKVINFSGNKNIPILAVTKSEPQGALRNFLGCLSKAGN